MGALRWSRASGWRQRQPRAPAAWAPGGQPEVCGLGLRGPRALGAPLPPPAALRRWNPSSRLGCGREFILSIGDLDPFPQMSPVTPVLGGVLDPRAHGECCLRPLRRSGGPAPRRAAPLPGPGSAGQGRGPTRSLLVALRRPCLCLGLGLGTPSFAYHLTRPQRCCQMRLPGPGPFEVGFSEQDNNDYYSFLHNEFSSFLCTS